MPSIPKILGVDDFKFGSVKDVRFIAGINRDADANVRKYPSGIQLGWDLPGFIDVEASLPAERLRKPTVGYLMSVGGVRITAISF